ncbi:helix-turn-helix domain-containing protein [Mobilicoccus caccae]|uniref:Transcriptional regulator n=1 Tax=Mobilicoccus caccae TaxID=1859295 RepID=A0ABQ6IWA1_9MICO|nr:helix-turn-helix transcriptional regulator [Mobilicoccus caccae]GMA40994.1 transcriptional regulator [Mobilicoccus caccae]
MPRLTPHVPGVPGMRDLGEYVREQRENAQLSVRQLSAAAGISNPYLSQIERGLRRPSAEILNSLAKGLQVSAESLYVRAGLLDASHENSAVDVRRALALDRHLTARQRGIMLDLYDSFVPRRPVDGATTSSDPGSGGDPARPADTDT